MNEKQRAKMPRSQRAKQFAPFDAVVGLRQALKEKERIRVQRKQLFEDRIEQINNILKNIDIHDTVTVVYYDNKNQEYLEITGLVRKIAPKKQIIEVSTIEIEFENIYEIIKL